ncbi:MAG TPA: fatty acyl-AMP ligase, partial [Polyangiaceae bacterium]|nr:fatty acyl-AMP ligase [Polyangiaceae bacterium]
MRETHSRVTTIVDVLRQRARHTPDKLAYTFLGDDAEPPEEITYAALGRWVTGVAARLCRVAARGDRVLLLYPAGLDFVAGFLGVLAARMVAVPAYLGRQDRDQRRLRVIAENARIARVLTCWGFFEHAWQKGAIEDLGLPVSFSDDAATEDCGDDGAVRIGEEELALLQYTSGSTGQQKGVKISHKNILHNQETLRRAFQHSEQSRIAGWLPHYHDMGLIGNILQPVYVGGHCILMSPYQFLRRPARWLEAISCFRATTSGAPNFAYQLCVQRITAQEKDRLDLSSWSVAFTGAEMVRAATLQRFAEEFASCGFRRQALYPCYGLAESTLLVSGGIVGTGWRTRHLKRSALVEREIVEASAGHSDVEAVVSCGMPRGGKVVIADNAGGELPERRLGEICVNGESVAGGYWQNEELSRRAFPDSTTAGRHLRTGDLGFLWDGELYICGRKTGMIVLYGTNYFAEDLEDLSSTSD